MSLCYCGHDQIYHVQLHYQCNPLGEECDCREFQFAPERLVETCSECGGDGADHEDSSRDCFMCGGSGVVIV